MPLDLGLEDFVESERAAVVIAFRIARCFLIVSLKFKAILQGSRIRIMSPNSQMRKGGSAWLQCLSRVIWLFGVYLQILIPLLSPPTMVLPIITIISANRIFTSIFQPKSTETFRNIFPPILIIHLFSS